jgi:hypothetical protein
VVDNWYLWGQKHGLVATYPIQNVISPDQQEFLRGRYQGTSPDSFPRYLAPAAGAVPMMMDSTMMDSTMAPPDSAAADTSVAPGTVPPSAPPPDDDATDALFSSPRMDQ